MGIKLTDNEIGKLEDGQPDPCYDCVNSDTDSCLSCDSYGEYKAPDTNKEVNNGTN